MGQWMRRRGSRYGRWHYPAEMGEARFNRPGGIVAACGLILGRTELELEVTEDLSNWAERCPVCRSLGPIPTVRR